MGGGTVCLATKTLRPVLTRRIRSIKGILMGSNCCSMSRYGEPFDEEHVSCWIRNMYSLR